MPDCTDHLFVMRQKSEPRASQLAGCVHHRAISVKRPILKVISNEEGMRILQSTVTTIICRLDLNGQNPNVVIRRPVDGIGGIRSVWHLGRGEHWSRGQVGTNVLP